MKVVLERIGHAAFEATAGSGGKLVVDGSPEIGGEGRGMRPMELLLSAVASCSAMDVVHILVNKQKQPLESLRIEIEGARADATPAPFTKMHLVYIAKGAVEENKLQRAVQLAVEKYCSVSATLSDDVPITWEARLEPPGPRP
jgi:putative redox protein